MRRVIALWVLSCCVIGSAGPASAQTAAPYRTLFAVAPIDRAGGPPNDIVAAPDLLAVASNIQDPPGIQQPSAPTHPKPEHTGFGALVYGTAADFKAFPQRKSTWVILGIGLGAAGLAHIADDDIQEHYADAGSAAWLKPGKYLGSFYVQLGTASGLYLIGRYAMKPSAAGGRTNKVSHLGFDMVRALVLSQTLTQGFKYAVQRDRPTGECCAFPSGHASAAFATASVLERHLGYRGAWPTFVIASYVAASRLSDNRHFLSDVVFGSALGIASGWTVVGRHGRSEYAMVPVPTRGGVMLTLQTRPRTDDRGRATR